MSALSALENIFSAIDAVPPGLLFSACVIFFGVIVLLRVRYLLRRGERFRKKRLMRRPSLEAVFTDSPIDDPKSAALDRGIENIEKHATVLRRTLIPLIVFGIVAIALLPLMTRVPATIVSVVVAIITVTVGIAARPVLENAIAGLVMSFSRLVNIGDTVEIEGQYGTVEDITTTHTTIKLWDWRRYILPNTAMLGSSFLNYSVIDRYQWAYVEFWVSFRSDLEEVRALAIEAPKSSKFFLGEEEPQFWVMELGERGLRCWIAAWARTPSQAWELKNDVRTVLAREFNKRGILTHLSQQSWSDETGTRAVRRPGADTSE